jgi:hypothetical protein
LLAKLEEGRNGTEFENLAVTKSNGHWLEFGDFEEGRKEAEKMIGSVRESLCD